MTTGKVAERDAELAYEITLSGNSRYFDPTLSDKITAALATVRQAQLEWCVEKLKQIAADYDNVQQPNTEAAISKQAIQYAVRHLESTGKQT